MVPIEALLKTLIDHSGGPAISIYIPTHRKGPGTEQDPIRLHNQIAKADASLEDLGFKPRSREGILAEARALLRDRGFWEHRQSGLGVFVTAEGTTTTVTMHHAAPERTVVADSFHIRPLLIDLDPLEVQVLVLTMGRVRLYVMSRDGIEVAPADLPDSFEDVNWFVDREAALQHHSDSRGGSRVHHGHDPQDLESADRDRFLAAIDDALPPGKANGFPLVVLGVDDLADRFIARSERKAVSPPRSGVGDADDANQVRDRATPALDEIEAANREKIMETARAQMGKGHGLFDLAESLRAAVAGRVSELILDADADPVWGRFDPENLELEVHGGHEAGDVDLVDRLAVHALQTGAEVKVVSGGVDGKDLVAITRF